MEKIGEPSKIEQFKNLKNGEVVQMDISLIQPSQPNDYYPSRTRGPIEVCLETEKILIVNGNHRYWEIIDNLKEDEKGLISIKKVENPYKTRISDI